MKKLFILLFLCFFCFFYCTKKGQKKLRSHSISKNVSFTHWIPFHLEGENFSASFPKKPEMRVRDLPIPGSDASFLSYKEFFCEIENGTLCSIGYATLPSNWLKYGTSLVLKQALKMIEKELGKIEIVGKKITSFKSFPALDYEHYTISASEIDQKETSGTLVLVGNILYKIEMTYSSKLHEDIQNPLGYFIENFCPEEKTQESHQPE